MVRGLGGQVVGRWKAESSLVRIHHRSDENKNQEYIEMNSRIQSVSELAVRVAQDPGLAEQIKENPAGAIADVAAPLQSDAWIYRMVVAALGLAVLISVIGAIILSVAGKPIPELLTALGSAAIGALAGLLAPSPASRG